VAFSPGSSKKVWPSLLSHHERHEFSFPFSSSQNRSLATMTAKSSAETAQTIKTLLKKLPEERADAARLDELRRVFGKLVANGDLTFFTTGASKQDGRDTTPTQKWNAFLQKSHRLFVEQLCQRIQKGKRTSVRTMWGVIAASPVRSTSSSSSSCHDRVNPDLMYLWMRSMTLLEQHMDNSTRTMMEGEFLHPFRDVQYYALTSIAKLATEEYDAKTNDEHGNGVAEQLFQLLLMIPIPKTQEEMQDSNYLFSSSKDMPSDQDNDRDDESVATNQSDEESVSTNDESSDDEQEDQPALKKLKPTTTSSSQRSFTFQQLKSHKKALANAWFAVLKLPLSLSALKSALQFLPRNVIPHVANPLRFADFFMQAFASQTEVISLLALEGLFLLMTQHGLEYPLFYTSLYTLVQPNIFFQKYRVRFFELLTKCLSQNDMLPAHVIAAFCKRLVRSALSVPPPGILFCLALVSNLLRKHSECAALIHRGTGEPMEDPFDPYTNDPTQAGALESSLWELESLSHHYYPAVVTMAKSIGTEDKKMPHYNIHDFLRHSYKSLFDQERPTKKRRNQKTALTFCSPKALFSEGDELFGVLDLPGE
jgi:U3 small nucleolar RNA-associated protein 19